MFGVVRSGSLGCPELVVDWLEWIGLCGLKLSARLGAWVSNPNRGFGR